MTSGRVPAAGVIAALMAWGLVPPTVGAQTPSILTVAQSAAVMALDPAEPPVFPARPAGDDAAFLVYDGLVRFNEQLTLVPQLATSWTVASDGRTWTFKIRGGVAFQDGSPLTAQAVVANFKRAVDRPTDQSTRPATLR